MYWQEFEPVPGIMNTHQLKVAQVEAEVESDFHVVVGIG